MGPRPADRGADCAPSGAGGSRVAAVEASCAAVEFALGQAEATVCAKLRRGEVHRLVGAVALVIALDVLRPDAVSCAWARTESECGLLCAAAIGKGLAVRVVWQKPAR